jgi:hypothetical protein
VLRSWPPVPTPPAVVQATERAIANARAFLALAALAAVYVDPGEPSRFPDVAYALLWAYIVFSLMLLAFV